MSYTRQEKREVALREVRKRERVFARLVADGKMSRAFADRQIAIGKAIADDYVESDLFGSTA